MSNIAIAATPDSNVMDVALKQKAVGIGDQAFKLYPLAPAQLVGDDDGPGTRTGHDAPDFLVSREQRGNVDAEDGGQPVKHRKRWASPVILELRDQAFRAFGRVRHLLESEAADDARMSEAKSNSHLFRNA